MKNVWGPFQEGLVVMAIFDPYISPLDEKLSMHFFFKFRFLMKNVLGLILRGLGCHGHLL